MSSSESLRARIAGALADTSPSSLIDAASSLASIDPSGLPTPHGADPAASIAAQLAPVFVEADDPETNAVLRVWAEILDDDMLRRRVRTSVSTREHPAWLSTLKDARITRADSRSDVFGEQETLLLDVEVGGHKFALACALMHAGGVMLEDAYLIPASIDEAYASLPAEVTDNSATRALDLADAGELLRGALRLTNMTFPPIETESWPSTKPAIEWLLRLLPGEEPEWGEAVEPATVQRITTEFEASREAKKLTANELDHAHLLFEFAANYGTGDPMRWGPMFTERLLLDLVPRKYMAPDQELLRIPRLLTAVVTWANGRSGIAPDATQRVIGLIEDLTPEYRGIVKQGHSGSLGNMLGTSIEDLLSGIGSEAGLITNLDFETFLLGQLEDRVGGAAQLQHLDTLALPAETFAEAAIGLAIPGDIIPRLSEIAALIEVTGTQYFGDPEMVTVALRVLVRSAAGDPAIFRRRAKNESAAAAACWLAGRNNNWFQGHHNKARSVKALMEAFGVKTTPQQRAETMLRAMGVNILFSTIELSLGDASLLSSECRAAIIAQRDA